MERYGGNRDCRGPSSWIVMVWRDMEVTEIVDDPVARLSRFGETWR